MRNKKIIAALKKIAAVPTKDEARDFAVAHSLYHKPDPGIPAYFMDPRYTGTIPASQFAVEHQLRSYFPKSFKSIPPILRPYTTGIMGETAVGYADRRGLQYELNPHLSKAQVDTNIDAARANRLQEYIRRGMPVTNHMIDAMGMPPIVVDRDAFGERIEANPQQWVDAAMQSNGARWLADQRREALDAIRAAGPKKYNWYDPRRFLSDKRGDRLSEAENLVSGYSSAARKAEKGKERTGGYIFFNSLPTSWSGSPVAFASKHMSQNMVTADPEVFKPGVGFGKGGYIHELKHIDNETIRDPRYASQPFREVDGEDYGEKLIDRVPDKPDGDLWGPVAPSRSLGYPTDGYATPAQMRKSMGFTRATPAPWAPKAKWRYWTSQTPRRVDPRYSTIQEGATAAGQAQMLYGYLNGGQRANSWQDIFDAIHYNDGIRYDSATGKYYPTANARKVMSTPSGLTPDGHMITDMIDADNRFVGARRTALNMGASAEQAAADITRDYQTFQQNANQQLRQSY